MLTILLMFTLMSTVQGGFVQIYIRKCAVFFITLATDEDKRNPFYSDPCVVDLATICTYCCILQISSCSRDNRACNPVYHKDFSPLLIMLSFIMSVTIGCKIISLFVSCLIK